MFHNSNAFVAAELVGFGTESSDSTFGVLTGYGMNPAIEVDELRHKLVTLNAQLKSLDRELDYSRIIAKFEDAPEDHALVERMQRQVDRMQSELERLQKPFGALHSPPTPYQPQLPSASSSSEIRPALGPGPATRVNSGAPAEIVQKTFLGECAAAPHIRRGRSRPTAQPESAPL